VPSGQSSPLNGAPQLQTGLTTPTNQLSYPDFPRVGCSSVIYCTIEYDGINNLGLNYINSASISKTGWIIVSFPGDGLIQQIVNSNLLNFTPCNSTQIAGGCTSCSNTGICLTCNTTANYLYDSVNFVCLAAPSYYLNNSVPTMCNITIFGCSLCSSSTVCSGCNSTANYTINSSLNVCIAAPGFYLDPSTSLSIACNISMPGCTSCTSNIVCTGCDSSLFLMLQGSSCVCDSSNNFITAPISLPMCICNTGYYFNGITCVLMPNCTATASTTICSSCDSSSVCNVCNSTLNYILLASSGLCICNTGYYFDGTNCVVCNSNLIGCTQCMSSTVCLVCDNQFDLTITDCTCKIGTYLNNTNCNNCQIGCLSCTSLKKCLTCDISNNFIILPNNTCGCNVGYYLNSTTNICLSCSSIPGCLACNINGCTSCNTALNYTLGNGICICPSGFYPGSNGFCTACTMIGCNLCSS
jgi:proprotein convertase subtilisin/kexin type 5